MKDQGVCKLVKKENEYYEILKKELRTLNLEKLAEDLKKSEEGAQTTTS